MGLPKAKPPEFDPEHVRQISVAVYKMRLDASRPGATERMLAKDDDGGEKLANRAQAYDALTRCYLRVLKTEEVP